MKQIIKIPIDEIFLPYGYKVDEELLERLKKEGGKADEYHKYVIVGRPVEINRYNFGKRYNYWKHIDGTSLGAEDIAKEMYPLVRGIEIVLARKFLGEKDVYISMVEKSEENKYLDENGKELKLNYKRHLASKHYIQKYDVQEDKATGPVYIRFEDLPIIMDDMRDFHQKFYGSTCYLDGVYAVDIEKYLYYAIMYNS